MGGVHASCLLELPQGTPKKIEVDLLLADLALLLGYLPAQRGNLGLARWPGRGSRGRSRLLARPPRRLQGLTTTRLVFGIPLVQPLGVDPLPARHRAYRFSRCTAASFSAAE